MRLQLRLRIRTLLVVALFVFGFGQVSQTQADIVAFLDYNNFDTRLDELAGSAGVADFSAAEVSQIQSNIQSRLELVFGGYTVDFSDTAPQSGNFETINFGLTASPGALGLADRIDYRNQSKNDVARVYSANFAFIVESGDTRARQITELSIALAGTAAHELGHNIGLQHHDSFGNVSFTATNKDGGGPSGGAQNSRIMATGSTGLGEGGRETQRFFSDISHAKLEYTDGLVDTVLASTNEQSGAHGSIATSQHVELQRFVNGETEYFDGANIIGRLNSAAEHDFYSFDLLQGDKIAFTTMSDSTSTINDDIDSFLEFYDENGDLLVSNDDIFYNSSGINNGGSRRTLDSMLLNYEIDAEGTYYLKLRAFGTTDTGNYELLVARSTTAVPEPGTFGLMAVASVFLAGVTVLRRRNRRRKSAKVQP